MKWLSGSSLGIFFSLLLAGCVQSPSTISTSQVMTTADVAYVYGDHIWLYNTVSEQQQQLSTDAIQINGLGLTHPVLSANGEVVIFVQTVAQTGANNYYELWEYSLIDQTTQLLATHEITPQHLHIAPNGQYLTYMVGDVLYLTDLKTATTTRLHEGATDSAWSPNSRRIVYTTNDDRILTRQFEVNGELTEPQTLLAQAATALLFTSNQTLLFSGETETGFTVLEYQLNEATVTPVTSLRFETQAPQAQLRIDASGERLLYERPDATAGNSVVWLIYLKKDISKQLIEDASGAVWSNTDDEIYYQTLDPLKLYQSSVTGLNRTLFVTGGSAITTTATLGSNDYIP